MYYVTVYNIDKRIASFKAEQRQTIVDYIDTTYSGVNVTWHDSIAQSEEPLFQLLCNPVKPTFNKTPFERLLDLAEKAETFVCAELSEYDKDLMQLHEQCRKCELTSYGLFIAIDTLANKHVIHAKRVIADLFAC